MFIALSETKFTKLIQFTDFKDEDAMVVFEYSAIGSFVAAAVPGFKQTGQKI